MQRFLGQNRVTCVQPIGPVLVGSGTERERETPFIVTEIFRFKYLMKDITLTTKSTAELHPPLLLIFNQTYWTLTSVLLLHGIQSFVLSFSALIYLKKKKKKKTGILKFLNNFLNLFKKIIFFNSYLTLGLNFYPYFIL